ncbi:MAG: hypothetical protein FWC71_05785 [Defluviitaleaceae bacterium]|nr:hypothetical protein [Defluviitaleaceae bacterium]
MFKRLKTPLILLLAALAVYQTGQLWFVHLTNRNLGVFFRAMFESPAPDGYVELTRPMRVVARDENQRTRTQYGVTCQAAEEAFGQVLRRGVFTGVVARQYASDNLQDTAFVLYEYAVMMRAEIFALAFGTRGNTRLLDDEVERFDAVAVTAGSVIFLGEEYAWTYALPEAIILPEVQMTPSRNFVSVPYNPYARSGEVRLDTVNAQIAHFFDNPATRSPRFMDNIITISNVNTVVQLLPGNRHVLYYRCFRPFRRDGVPDFLMDFSAALAFVNADPNVTNDFYLAGYEARGRTHIFSFNLLVSHGNASFPLEAPEIGWGPSDAPLFYPIEVTVERGHVTRYRKLAYTFHAEVG